MSAECSRLDLQKLRRQKPWSFIIQTGITRKKIPCYLHSLDCRWRIAKKKKNVKVILNILNSPGCDKL